MLLVESDGRAAQVIRQNIAAVRLTGARLVIDRVERALPREPDGRPRDFVFADPPYAVGADEIGRVLAALLSQGWLAPGALVALQPVDAVGEPHMARKVTNSTDPGDTVKRRSGTVSPQVHNLLRYPDGKSDPIA